jgi:crotonobetainyl-CoA:carnitine CoA-transferase CaiB-like acyl-CoA transferase
MVRVTGFGQEGPYSSLPGFGTVVESMSSFAYITGSADGPPTLPAFGLADGIAGIAAAFATVSALLKRGKTGIGEMIDVALYEPLMSILGSHIIEYDQLGLVQQRTGNRSPHTAPRNTYRTKDQKWMALSASSQSIAERLFAAIGRRDMITDEKFSTNQARLSNINELDEILGA